MANITLRYRVVITRTAVYELDSTSADHAEAAISDRDIVHARSECVKAVPLCPDCGTELDLSTRREVPDQTGELLDEPAYCSACDREPDLDDDPTPDDREGIRDADARAARERRP